MTLPQVQAELGGSDKRPLSMEEAAQRREAAQDKLIAQMCERLRKKPRQLAAMPTPALVECAVAVLGHRRISEAQLVKSVQRYAKTKAA
jgi:hypothetical protein